MIHMTSQPQALCPPSGEAEASLTVFGDIVAVEHLKSSRWTLKLSVLGLEHGLSCPRFGWDKAASPRYHGFTCEMGLSGLSGEGCRCPASSGRSPKVGEG